MTEILARQITGAQNKKEASSIYKNSDLLLKATSIIISIFMAVAIRRWTPTLRRVRTTGTITITKNA